MSKKHELPAGYAVEPATVQPESNGTATQEPAMAEKPPKQRRKLSSEIEAMHKIDLIMAELSSRDADAVAEWFAGKFSQEPEDDFGT